MTKQERLVKFEILNYIEFRFNGGSNVTEWNSIRALNTHTGRTFQQMCYDSDNEFDFNFQPSLKQLKYVKKQLNK